MVRESSNHNKYCFIFRWLTETLKSGIIKEWNWCGSKQDLHALSESTHQCKIVWHYLLDLNSMYHFPKQFCSWVYTQGKLMYQYARDIYFKMCNFIVHHSKKPRIQLKHPPGLWVNEYSCDSCWAGVKDRELQRHEIT